MSINIRLNYNIHRTFSGLNDDPNPIEYFLNENNSLGVFIVPADPNWGGNMYTPVIDELFNELIEQKINVMRFSFIKYPISINDKYVKYIQQTSVCFEEFLKVMPHVQHIIVAGYSFGSLMALQLVLRRVEILGFICIAPPLLTYDFIPCLTQRKTSGLILYGTNDHLVPELLIEAFVNCLKSKKVNISLSSIIGADHYFSDKIPMTIKEITSYINVFENKIKINSENRDSSE